jgi:hypothetical protein
MAKHIRRLETHVTDTCPMRCGGCSHFSPLFREDEVSLESFRGDLELLSQGFTVGLLVLIGGEPFLKGDLLDYVDTAKRLLPGTRLEVFSNARFYDKDITGALIARGCRIWFSGITHMNPWLPRIPKEWASNVKFEKRDKYVRFLRSSPTGTPKEGCMNKHCRFLRDGKVFRCPVTGLIHKFNEAFGTSYTVEKGDYVDLTDPKDVMDIKKLDGWVPFCKNCGNEPMEITVGKTPEKEDWLVSWKD